MNKLKKPTSIIAETGVIHGRFQILHHDHLKYLLAGKERCHFLVVGITNPDPSLTKREENAPKRDNPLANPLTYYERQRLVYAALQEHGISAHEFTVVPFPINFPELYQYYVPMDALFFLSIYDDWGRKKYEYFKELGVNTHILREVPIEKKGISSTDIRSKIISDKPWAHLVPRSVAKLLNTWDITKRLKAIIRRIPIQRTLLIALILLSLFCLVPRQTLAETIFTYQAKESEKDTRREHDRDLLQLALEKTKVKYGPYRLVPSPVMNSARSIKTVIKGELSNFFVKFSATDERMTKMGFVPFPVDRGIVGYRVFFVSPAAKDRLKRVESLDHLKEFTMGQGAGWLDTDILKYNGFNVIMGSSYEGLFEMVSRGRVDLFPRGANELLNEFESHKTIKNLLYDNSIVLYYPLPRFFFSTKTNTKALKRIEEGLITAYQDGSLIKLWEKHYGPSIEFVGLEKRKIFKIDNPFIKEINNSYEKYIYKP